MKYTLTPKGTSSAKTAHHPKNMAANSEPMGRKMKLSPPTTKTQKPQRYLTLLYRHLAAYYTDDILLFHVTSQIVSFSTP
jgi:hypothetical protein